MARWEERFRWHLLAIPELILLARSAAVNPLRAKRLDKDRVQTSGEDSPLPFRVEGADDADYLWALLVLYGTEVAERIGGASPQVLRTGVWTVREAQGLRAGVAAGVAAEDARAVVLWLVERAETIGSIAELDDAEEVLFSLVRSMRRRYGQDDRPEPDRKRPCPVCGERAVIATWATVAGQEAVLVVCLVCRARFEGGEDANADVLASGEACPT